MNTKPWNKRLLDYFIKTLNGMAYGLFSTLIIGVIIKQIGQLTGWDFLIDLYNILAGLMGIGIGIGVAYSLNLTGLKLIVGAIAGGIATKVISPDPMVAYLTTILSIEIIRLIFRKPTPVDIIIIPLIGTISAFGIASLIGPPVALFMNSIGAIIQSATTIQPFLMGIVIAVVMGILLTAPVSSAAIAISITLGGIAGGAAVIGGAVQMIGFAVMSRKDNSIGTVLSIGFGTSMLQFKNILRKPVIWLPTIIVSAILGPVSTVVFQMKTDYLGSGMGTSGLVGQFATTQAMGSSSETIFLIILIHFILPIILVLVIDIIFRKLGWIETGDLSLKEVK